MAGWLAVTVAGLGIAVKVAAVPGYHLPECVLRAATGVPCPGCGITRLATAVLQGHITTVLRADPAGMAFLVIVAGLAVTQVLALSSVTVPGFRRGRASLSVIAVLLAAHWATTIATGGLAPST